MLFNSVDFLVYFPIVFFLYWVFSRQLQARNIFLIIASYFFYGWWDWRFLLLITISSLTDFLLGQLIYKSAKPRTRKAFLILSLLINLGSLCYFKYSNFFIASFIDAFSLFGRDIEVNTLNIILPVGISFYTFQTLSYTIDIYRRQLIPTKNPFAFFAFVSFFPQLVAGPIERASHLLPQFEKVYSYNYSRIRDGLLLAGWGLFKKMVIADRLALLVNEVYNSPSDYTGMDFSLATLFFTFQIYCDFSGYSDIAIGLSRTMGFDLMKNFRSPYFSSSLTEFWRRWHISLSTWFRDYVYIPLGGSRKGPSRTYINLFLVFVISGLWHGAGLNYIIWGAIHGLFIVSEKALSLVKFSKSYKVGNILLVITKCFRIGFTFFVVLIAWVFFRASNLDESLIVLEGIFSFSHGNAIDTLGMSLMNVNLSFSLILMLLTIEYLNTKINLKKLVLGWPMVPRWSIYIIIIISIIVLGVYGGESPEFIYFQF